MFVQAIDQRLQSIAATSIAQEGQVGQALAASLVAPGKRLRPLITMMSARALGGDHEPALAPACAIEMIHAASLIVDDLPALDDAQMRRGAPACHIRFGEEIAVLAAFALLNKAHQMTAAAPDLSAEQRLALIGLYTDAVGAQGLIGGQEMDLAGRGDQIDDLHRRKTGALFVAAAKAGAVVADAPNGAVDAMGIYATHLGQAFQIHDDLLDTFASMEQARKDVARDNPESNFVALHGADNALSKLAWHVQEADTALFNHSGPSTPESDQARTDMDGLSGIVHSILDNARSLRDPSLKRATSAA